MRKTIKNINLSDAQPAWGAFAAVAALLLAVLALHLLLALLAALAVYGARRALAVLLEPRLGRVGAELAALVLILAWAAALVGVLYLGAAELQEAYHSGRLLRLTESALATVQHFGAWLPAWWQDKLPQTPADVQQLLLQWSDAHPSDIKILGQLASRAVLHLLVGAIIGFLAGARGLPREERPITSPFAQAWRGSWQRLEGAFGDIVSAQLRISLLNTLLTGLFLFVALPALGQHMPLSFVLVLITFVAGLLPIVGNLISNTAITLVALTVSPWLALAALLFLIAVHKLEYFINAKIMGHKLQVHTFELLAVMLLMEAAFGVGGLVAAPVYYAWLLRELRVRRIF